MGGRRGGRRGGWVLVIVILIDTPGVGELQQ